MHAGAEPDALSAMKASDQVHLTKSGLLARVDGGLSGKVDHKHKCANCGYEWACDEFSTKKKCEGPGGVFYAAKVNKEGPYCLMCLHLEMGRRIGYLRGLEVKTTIVKIP